ncbi:hypothetical protein [Bradyrhizobium genosp. P]|uniref:hypothetical protein n=1 Tax=Bradyrhizobium genosp. P TaxID=83641 RepID=UPI003CFB4E92
MLSGAPLEQKTMKMRQPLTGEAEAREAEDRLLSLAESATDEEISEAAADWLLTRFSAPAPYCLTVPHAIYDKQSTALHAGHPLLTVDYYGRSWIGLSTRDRDRARRWIICAMMLDYTVTICVDRRDRDGFTPGDIATVRRNAAQRRRIFERA